MLKAGFAAYRDDAELEEGGTNSEWVKRQWWELTGNGILIVYEKEGGKVVKEIQLSDVTKVDRTKGDEYYQYCIDLDVEPAGKEERTITLKPPNRSDMASWLGLLKEHLDEAVRYFHDLALRRGRGVEEEDQHHCEEEGHERHQAEEDRVTVLTALGDLCAGSNHLAEEDESHG